ncbi:hypothetical protein AVEN_100869-1 [Araneus ventricosus]|uniref:Pre-C2HC domain-containing protein n=1 Tax=Araneus ventricosus TaxID=182803 RepID=A0A4Y2AWA4_ARAVE|nr:hypothetical protein AVEN_100869-1 [Araneus ventricosus]
MDPPTTSSWVETEVPQAPMDLDESATDVEICQFLTRAANRISYLLSAARITKEMANCEKNDDLVKAVFREKADKVRMEIAALQEQVSNIDYCPIVNCAVHTSNCFRTNANRTYPNSDSDDEIITDKNDPDTNSFRLPPKRLTAKNLDASDEQSKINFSDKNKFSTLENDDVGASPDIPTPVKKPPPIMLKKLENFTAQLKFLNEKFGQITAKAGGDFIRLHTKNPDEHSRLIQFLKENEIEHFIIIPKWERPIKVVVRDLPRESRTHQIKDYLEEVYNLKIDKVVQLTKLRTKRPLPLFQITLTNSQVNKKIWSVNEILYFKVRIERFQRRTGALQCFNCNLHNHTAATCNLKARCLKCGDNHSHLQCNKTFELNDEGRIKTPKCINCKEEGHLASWRGCKNFPKKTIKNIRYVNQNFSFADAARTTSNEIIASLPNPTQTLYNMNSENLQGKTENLNDALFVLAEFKKLFGNANISELASKLKTTIDPLDKLQLFTQFIKF